MKQATSETDGGVRAGRALQVAYLGPEGTFAHLVAQKRYRGRAKLVPRETIADVFDYVQKTRGSVGVVPIENSSGGTIYDTVDELVKDTRHTSVVEELSIRVNLALIGHRGKPIKALYSHFAPMHHCDAWIRKNLPHVRRYEVSSTAAAADMASRDPQAAALSTRGAARRYSLDVLRYPVSQDTQNVTQFFAIGRPKTPHPESRKTSLVVTLKNRPGSLYDFLQPFRGQSVNLTRILSRPLMGHPNSYVFLIDIDGTPDDKPVDRALAESQDMVHSLRIIGVYPVRKMYAS